VDSNDITAQVSGQQNIISLYPFDFLNKMEDILALECEMVGVGRDGKTSVIARVSLVNENLDCVYDEYVKLGQTVVDYRTSRSGINPEHLETGKDFQEVQEKVLELIKDKILVGHGITKHDLNVLKIYDHPKTKIRDTSTYRKFMKSDGGEK
jgi:RNA exonuclease 4